MEISLKWLADEHRAALKPVKGESDDYINALTAGELILDSKILATWFFTDNNMELLSSEQVHVLVVVPKGTGGDQILESSISHDAFTRIHEHTCRMSDNVEKEIRERDRKIADEIRKRDRKIVEAFCEHYRKILEEIRELNDKRAEETRQLVERTIARALVPATPSKPDLQLGYEHVGLLLQNGYVSSAEETVGADAFWSVEVQAQVDCIKREDSFDAFITPYFTNALDSHDVVFVHSELYNSLPQSGFGNSNTAQIPDGFVTHRGMYHKEPEPNDGVSRAGTSFRFGKAIKALFDCLVLFESNITEDLEGAPFGQVMQYIQHVFPKGSGNAVLFDRTAFWLIKSINGVVARVINATWVMGGSKALFRDFITENLSPWVTRLTAACSALNVEVVEGDAFLGRGAFGRVFKVKRVGQDGDVLALKIVEKISIGRLFLEYDALGRAKYTGWAIRPVGEATEISDGAAMLLSPVGKPISYPTTNQEARVLFDMLWQLHSAGVTHGDPRVPNVIVKDGRRLWIDFSEWWHASPLLMQNDAKILTQSILRVYPKDLQDLELEALISKYGASPTQANLNLLADKVGERLTPSQTVD